MTNQTRCKAEFLDGPLRGEVREFDRIEPPEHVYSHNSTRDVSYKRDVNPFDDGERWIYMLEAAE